MKLEPLLGIDGEEQGLVMASRSACVCVRPCVRVCACGPLSCDAADEFGVGLGATAVVCKDLKV